MSEALDLVGVEGPMEGERFPLDPAKKLLLGRKRKGIHFYDPLVSIEHAEIEWTTDRYWITDLGSLTGTFVNERRLEDEPVGLKKGDRIRIGESVLEVGPRPATPLGVVFAVSTGAAVASLVMVAIIVAMLPLSYQPVLEWKDPVRQGAHASRTVAIPLDFVRNHGLDHRRLEIDRVTDFDEDGVDELWIDGADRRFVVTFEADGSWRMVGELPQGCRERAGWPFPDLSCDGESYVFRDGAYQRVGHEGVVAWVWPRSARGVEESAPVAPLPHRVTLIERERLAGFLAERGVHEPVHYLLCEEAVPGVRAQVRTASGELRALDFGCLRGLQFSGGAAREFGARMPVAVAFTAGGRQALLDDVTAFLSGSTDGLFLDGRGRAVRAALSRPPEHRTMVRLAFQGASTQGNPVAPEADLAEVGWLLPSGTVEGVPRAPATTAIIEGPGRFRIDGPGCTELEVHAGRWHCALSRWCRTGDRFVEVRQVGCDRSATLATGNYVGGVSGGRDAHVEVRVQVEAITEGLRADVLRTRVGWRPRGDGADPVAGP